MLNIVLYQPEMPANVGNIIRTSVALDARLHIIGPTVLKLDDKSLQRAGLDYVQSSSIVFYDTYDDFHSKTKDKTVVYITRYSKQNYASFDYGRFDQDIYVMFGNESHGIPLDILRNHKDYCLRIPMVANARSLNLANSVAIVAYEIMRQQGFYNLATSEMIKGEDYL